MNKHFVAVYGTLKTGKHNHHLMNKIHSEFVGKGKTIEKYPLLIGNLPYLYDVKGIGNHVEVEVYKVDDSAMAVLDRFEGHPNFYIRKEIYCELEKGETHLCYIYFINNKKTKFDYFEMHESF